MSFNPHVRNEWQCLTLKMSPNQEYVTMSNTKCRVRYANNFIMAILQFHLEFEETGNPEDFLKIKLDVDIPAPLDKVRHSTIMPHTDVSNPSDPPLFSHALIEYDESGVFTCTSFPFNPGRCYDMNTQFFFQVQ
jgi:hypothetical protein